MDLLCVIRRWHGRDQLSIREISRRTGLSWHTIHPIPAGQVAVIEPFCVSIPDKGKLYGIGANIAIQGLVSQVFSHAAVTDDANFFHGGDSESKTRRRKGSF